MNDKKTFVFLCEMSFGTPTNYLNILWKAQKYEKYKHKEINTYIIMSQQWWFTCSWFR